ncbi:MAG: helix-turn-helix domain-containing protein [Pseudonocardiaceae bacterium]
MIDRQAVVEAQRILGRRLAELRKAAGYSQHQFAPFTLYARSTIANVEVGRQHVPRMFWQRCDDTLDTGGALSRSYDDLQALIRQQRAKAAHTLHKESPEPADDREQRRDHIHPEAPSDLTRRRVLVTCALATTAAWAGYHLGRRCWGR